jgi:hypothetical protein
VIIQVIEMGDETKQMSAFFGMQTPVQFEPLDALRSRCRLGPRD